jgi:hypothetical protein
MDLPSTVAEAVLTTGVGVGLGVGVGAGVDAFDDPLPPQAVARTTPKTATECASLGNVIVFLRCELAVTSGYTHRGNGR